MQLARTISVRYRREMEIKQTPKYSHQFLKVVEVVEYHGRTGDFELVKYLIQNAAALEKLIIHPVQEWYPDERFMIKNGHHRNMEEKRRRASKQLKELVPSTLEFICRLVHATASNG